MNKIWCGFLAIGLMSFSLSSCKIFKHKPSKKKKAEAAAQAKLADSTATAIKSQPAVVDTNQAMKELLEKALPTAQYKIEPKTFSTKAKMHYEGGEKSYDFVANIRMQKDSIIWVSVTVAGIVQVARAIITPDSFKAILYTEKEAYEGPISKISNILPAGLDFYSLQNVLLGNPVLKNGNAVSVSEEGNNWLFRFVQENYIEQAQFDKSDSTLRSNQLITQGTANKSLTQTISNFGQYNAYKIGADRTLRVISDSSNILVEMSYANIVVDAEQTFPFSIPKNYKVK